VGNDPNAHWAKYNREYWRTDHEDFLWFFVGKCFSEPHSTKQIEDGVRWGLETSGEVLVADSYGSRPDKATLSEWCGLIDSPVLLLHGDQDQISPLHRSVLLAELTRGELVTLHGAGHIPLARDPVKVNLLIEEFARQFKPRSRAVRRGRTGTTGPSASSTFPRRSGSATPGAMWRSRPHCASTTRRADRLAGTASRDTRARIGRRTPSPRESLARQRVRAHRKRGGRTRPALLRGVAAHGRDPVANFMVFHDVVTETPYDLVIGTSVGRRPLPARNPELKRFAYAWLTDFVGICRCPTAAARGAGHRRLQRGDDRAHRQVPPDDGQGDLRGNPDDIVDASFGPGCRSSAIGRDSTTTSPVRDRIRRPCVADREALRADSATGATRRYASSPWAVWRGRSPAAPRGRRV
jgi:hypothetical protein